LHLLIGLVLSDALPIDHGRRFSAKSGMRASVTVEVNPFSDAGIEQPFVWKFC